MAKKKSEEEELEKSDEELSREAEEKEQRRLERDIADMKTVLSSIQGRRVMWRFLEHCTPFQTIWNEGPRIHYNSGKQDVGHYIWSEIEAAEPEALFKMMHEAKIED